MQCKIYIPQLSESVVDSIHTFTKLWNVNLGSFALHSLDTACTMVLTICTLQIQNECEMCRPECRAQGHNIVQEVQHITLCHLQELLHGVKQIFHITIVLEQSKTHNSATAK